MNILLSQFFNESILTGLDADNNIVRISSYKLRQNYPNPFNSLTTIQFDLPSPSVVTIKIYNIQGKLVISLSDEKYWDAGAHTVYWDGKDIYGNLVSSGEYFCRMETGQYKETRKMLLLK
jgi:flagellar hook assembly protein FlgD